MRFLRCLVLILSSPLFAAAEIPKENRERPKVEDISAFDAQALLKAINDNQANEALFFPESAFLELKAIARPLDYYKQLLQWFRDDVKREHQRMQLPLSFESFRLGSCKWKEKGKEANSIPYLSCYKSVLKAKDSQQKMVQIEVRTLINWGKNWYITHLGPIPNK